MRSIKISIILYLHRKVTIYGIINILSSYGGSTGLEAGPAAFDLLVGRNSLL